MADEDRTTYDLCLSVINADDVQLGHDYVLGGTYMYSKKLGLKLLPSGTLRSLGGHDEPKYLWSRDDRKSMYAAYESKRNELADVAGTLARFVNYVANLNHNKS